MKHLPSIITATLLTLFGGFIVVSAQGYIPLVSLPGVTTSGQPIKMDTYLSGMIKLIIAVAGTLSILMLVIAGTKYVAASISPIAKKDAIGDIQNALIGLTLVLSSYLLLNTLNPKLVSFSLMLPSIALTPVTPVVTDTTAPSTCPGVANLNMSLLSVLGQSMENGTTVITSSSHVGIESNLKKIRLELIKLKNALGVSHPNALVQTNSFYRPYSYQFHLWEVWYKWIGDPNINLRLKDNVDPLCATLKGKVGFEYGSSRHGLGSIVSKPGCTSTHVYGKGIDLNLISFPTIGASDFAALNTYMATNNIDLVWGALAGDPWHFTLKNPPYTGCDAGTE